MLYLNPSQKNSRNNPQALQIALIMTPAPATPAPFAGVWRWDEKGIERRDEFTPPVLGYPKGQHPSGIKGHRWI